jgi:hypothetical protein
MCLIPFAKVTLHVFDMEKIGDPAQDADWQN